MGGREKKQKIALELDIWGSRIFGHPDMKTIIDGKTAQLLPVLKTNKLGRSLSINVRNEFQWFASVPRPQLTKKRDRLQIAQ